MASISLTHTSKGTASETWSPRCDLSSESACSTPDTKAQIQQPIWGNFYNPLG